VPSFFRIFAEHQESSEMKILAVVFLLVTVGVLFAQGQDPCTNPDFLQLKRKYSSGGGAALQREEMVRYLNLLGPCLRFQNSLNSFHNDTSEYNHIANTSVKIEGMLGIKWGTKYGAALSYLKSKNIGTLDLAESGKITIRNGQWGKFGFDVVNFYFDAAGGFTGGAMGLTIDGSNFSYTLYQDVVDALAEKFGQPTQYEKTILSPYSNGNEQQALDAGQARFESDWIYRKVSPSQAYAISLAAESLGGKTVVTVTFMDLQGSEANMDQMKSRYQNDY
jgi:hypothetical protein